MKPGVVWVLLTVCIPQFAAEPFTTKLGFDLMQITRRRDHCEAAIPECYELDQEELLIKKLRYGISCCFTAHVKPSTGNVMTFQARAEGASKYTISACISMRVTHCSGADHCKGMRNDKFFKISTTVIGKQETFRLPLEIRPEDLICPQCGKMVNCTLFSLDFYLEGLPKDALRQQLKHKGIRISPFTLNTAFPVKTDQAGGKNSFSGLLVRLDPDYQPPRQEYPRHSSLSRDVKTLSLEAVRVRAELEKFLPVLRLADRGDYPNAVIEAEKIVPGNRFAAIMLYLIYSRGYCGVPVDYQTAAKYFDMLFDFRFHTVEYYNLWKKYRFMPTVPNEKVTLLAWWRYETMQEVIPLRGKYPLRECYEEKMRNIGGVAARALYEGSKALSVLIEPELIAMARERGCAEAWADPFVPFEFRHEASTWTLRTGSPYVSPEQFLGLVRAAELGYVPAKLRVARILLGNYSYVEPDIPRARKLIQESIVECGRYEKIGCRHGRVEKAFAEELLQVIPNEKASTKELLKQWAETTGFTTADRMKFNLINRLLLQRNDELDCDYIRAMNLPKEQADLRNKIIHDTAEKGGELALQYCMNNLRSGERGWLYFYWAGIRTKGDEKKRKKMLHGAYTLLRDNKLLFSTEAYLRNLALLVPHVKEAQHDYRILTEGLQFKVECSWQEKIPWISTLMNGKQTVVIKLKPSDKRRYVDIMVVSPKHAEGKVFLNTNSWQKDERKNVQLYYWDSLGRANYFQIVDECELIPEKLRILIAPRSEPLDLFVVYQVKNSGKGEP